MLVASPAYLKQKGVPQSPEDLTRCCCLSYSTNARTETWYLSRGPSHRTHKARGLFAANNGDLLTRLVLQGEGIALLPRFIAADDLEARRLVQILPDWSAPEIWLTLFYPPYEQLPLRAATFSDFFETYVGETRPL